MYPSTDLVGDDGSSDVADLWFNLFKPKQDFPSSTNISDGSYCASALASTTQLRQNNCALVASPLLAIVLGAKSDNALEKTTAYLIGFGVWFVVLSVNAEGLFYLAYAMTLQIWIEVETNLRNEQHVASSGEYRSLRLDDTRIAVFFLFFVQFAFFGAGNVASIVSGNNIQAFPCIRAPGKDPVRVLCGGLNCDASENGHATREGKWEPSNVDRSKAMVFEGSD